MLKCTGSGMANFRKPYPDLPDTPKIMAHIAVSPYSCYLDIKSNYCSNLGGQGRPKSTPYKAA